MIITHHRLPGRMPLRSQFLQFKRRRLRDNTLGFPQWLPLALHWKPASRRTPLAASRGGMVSHFNTFATHLHAQVRMMATTVLQQTIAGVCAPGERIFRSIERSAPPQFPRRAQTDEPMRAPTISRSGESAGSLPRPLELRATSLHRGPESIPPAEALDLPKPRRAGEREPMRRVPWRTALPARVSAARLTVLPPGRAWSPTVLAGRQHDAVAQPKVREPRAKITHAEFFSSAPELIWPKAASLRRGDSKEATAHEPRVAGNDAIAAAAATRTTGATQSRSAPESAARKPTRLSDLEPSFVDRLADDVIRRVERRARIERERRGL